LYLRFQKNHLIQLIRKFGIHPLYQRFLLSLQYLKYQKNLRFGIHLLFLKFQLYLKFRRCQMNPQY
jgi:hypothetical protein